MKKEFLNLKVDSFLREENQQKREENTQTILLDLEYYLSEFFKISPNKNVAYSLSKITKKESIIETFENCNGYDYLKSLITSKDAKIRKYAYIICGNLKTQRAKEILIQFCEREDVVFSYSTIILALGSYELKELAQLFIDRINLDTPPKFIREMQESFNKAFPKKIEKCSYLKVDSSDKIILTTQKFYYDLLSKELPGKRTKSKIGVVIENVNELEFKKILNRLDYYDLYFYLEQFQTLSEENISSACKKFIEFSKKCDKIVGFRIDCTLQAKEKDFVIKKIKEIVSCENSVYNTPSDYSVTLKIIYENGYHFVVRPDFLIGDRFTYRKNHLPASINPVTANIIGKYSFLIYPCAEKICDPFCGTSTMLIERARFGKNLKLYGSDINEQAISFSKENSEIAGVELVLNRKNALNLNNSYDLIISNLPYGLRVGSHDNNEELYNGFISNLRKTLNDNGYAILYTADKKLLKSCVLKAKLKLVEEIQLISGGLYCSLFVLKK